MATGGRPKMTPFGGLVIEVLGGNIRVSLAGSNYAVTYHKPRNSRQLLARSLPVTEDRNASMTQRECLAMAWRAANDKAREIGCIRERSPACQAAGCNARAIPPPRPKIAWAIFKQHDRSAGTSNHCRRR